MFYLLLLLLSFCASRTMLYMNGFLSGLTDTGKEPEDLSLTTEHKKGIAISTSLFRAAGSLLACATLLGFAPQALGQDGASLKAKVLRDLGGKVIAISAAEHSVVNRYTGEPADGSSVARKVRPGAMTVLVGDSFSILQLDQNGDALGAGDQGALVAHLEIIDMDGVAYQSGETLPSASFIDTGILKNPGPDAVNLIAVVDGISHELTVEPGDGVVLNPGWIDLPAGADKADVTSRCICKCKCGGETVTFVCVGTGASISVSQVFQDVHELALNDGGNCARFDGDACERPSGGDGTLISCKTKIVLNPTVHPAP